MEFLPFESHCVSVCPILRALILPVVYTKDIKFYESYVNFDISSQSLVKNIGDRYFVLYNWG